MTDSSNRLPNTTLINQVQHFCETSLTQASYKIYIHHFIHAIYTTIINGYDGLSEKNKSVQEIDLLKSFHFKSGLGKPQPNGISPSIFCLF